MFTRLLKYFFYSILSLFLILLIGNVSVIMIAKKGIEDDLSRLPKEANLIVLGTSKRFASGGENLFFKYRITAAKKVVEEVDPEHVILSGSHPSDYYNEPEDMRSSLEDRGLDNINFVLDYKGENTQASLMNYAEKFPEDSLIIVTQKFHAYRCILISNQLGIDAVVYPAEEVSVDVAKKPAIREVFARVQAFLNIYIFNA